MSSRFIRFALVGGIGFIADISIFSIAHYLIAWPAFSARLLAFVCAATVTWFGNRKLTFASQDQFWIKQWAKFMSVASASAVPNLVIFKAILLVGDAAYIPMLALVMGVLAGMLSNYFISSVWVFKQHN